MKDIYVPNILPSTPIPEKEYYPKYWAERPLPIEGELLSSWITRTVMANLNSIESLLKGVTKRHPHFYDFDTNWDSEIMNLFIEKTSIPESKLLEMTLIKEKKEKDIIFEKYHQDLHNSNILNTMWITRLVWDREIQIISSTRFCPICLRTDAIPYFRKEWRIGYNVVCLKHNCLLENKCPICRAPLGYNRLEWDSKITNCWWCGYDLTKIKPISISTSDPLFISIKNFVLNKPDNDTIFKVIVLAWIIARNFDIGSNGEIRWFESPKPPHPIYNNHPLTEDEDLVEFWNDYSDRNKKRHLITSIPALFLVLGTAIRLTQDEALFNDFMKSYYLSPNFYKMRQPFECPEVNCDFKAFRVSKILEHYNRHLGERCFQCELCPKKFFSERELKAHRALHDLPHPFQCPLDDCDKTFRYEKQYLYHIRAVHEIRPYTCEFCHKSFFKKRDLEIHIRVHTGEKPFVCNYCGKRFAQSSALRSHRFVHTGKKIYECYYCGKRFNQSHSLSEHKRIHTGEKPFICTICGKAYKRKHHLKTHQRTHTGEKPFHCEICGKGFSDKGNLTKHKFIHTGKRPFVCDICGLSFRFRTNLTNHVSLHSGKKPYICDKCGKTFARKDYLKDHIKTHSGEKPFVCDRCQKSYSTKRSLKRHIESEHQKIRWKCPYCDKSYSRKDKLKAHAKKHHSGRPIEFTVSEKRLRELEEIADGFNRR